MGINNFANNTPEQRAEYGRKGGLKSGEVRRNKKAMKEVLSCLLDMTMKTGKHVDIDKIKSFADIKGKNLSVQEAILVTQIQKALKGDSAAAVYIRDTVGERPGEKVDITGAIPVVISGEDELED